MDQPPFDVPSIAPDEDVNKGDGPLSKEQVRRAEAGSPRPPRLRRPSLIKSLWYFGVMNLTLALFCIVAAFVWGFAAHSMVNFYHWGWSLVS